MAKRISLIAFVILFLLLLFAQTTLATSGACSYHGGVNCAAGPSANGNVICNDGWTGSSVRYDSMVECMGYDAQIIALEQEILDIKTKYQSDVAAITNDPNIPGGMKERQIDYLASKANTQIQNIELQEQQLRLNHLRNLISTQTSNASQSPSSAISNVSTSTNIVSTPTTPVCPSNAYYDNSSASCRCNSGFFGLGNQCVAGDAICQLKYGDNSYYDLSSNLCYCNEGYSFDSSKRCVANILQSSSTISNGSLQNQTSNAVNYFIGQNLKIGDTGNDVITLQKFLEAKGFFAMPAGTSRGYFGNLTRQALIAFQKLVGLPATGYCGLMTRNAIMNLR